MWLRSMWRAAEPQGRNRSRTFSFFRCYFFFKEIISVVPQQSSVPDRACQGLWSVLCPLHLGSQWRTPLKNQQTEECSLRVRQAITRKRDSLRLSGVGAVVSIVLLRTLTARIMASCKNKEEDEMAKKETPRTSIKNLLEIYRQTHGKRMQWKHGVEQ